MKVFIEQNKGGLVGERLLRKIVGSVLFTTRNFIITGILIQDGMNPICEKHL